MLHHRRPGRGLLPGLLLAVAAAAQEPKLGSSWYQDDVDLGFKFRAPKDWVFVPGSPSERNLIGKYTGERGQDLHLGRDAVLEVALYVVKFDRRGAAAAPEKRLVEPDEGADAALADIDAWMEEAIDEGLGWRRGEPQKPLKGALEGKVVLFEGLSSTWIGDEGERPEPQPVRAYAAVFALSPEVELALVGLGPGEPRKWRPFESAYAAIAKTLQPVPVAGRAGPAGNDPRSRKRADLELEVAKSPGWKLYETPNYFVLTNSGDQALIDELRLRLEAIRQVYEKDYPPELARKLRTGDPASVAPGGEEGPGALAEHTTSVVDPLELAKCSVVRLCLNREQYVQYGGSPDSSGYFSPSEEELLLYDDKEDEGRNATWAVLNHEGFHQYIYAFFGNVAPHPWFNEGTGDYYAGFQFNPKTKKIRAERDKGRLDDLMEIRDRVAPLRELVRWSQPEFYGANARGLEGWACYAQGWSFIWFLRTGASGAKCWRAAWGSILDRYLVNLVETGDPERALESAFADVDWDALEACWRETML